MPNNFLYSRNYLGGCHILEKSLPACVVTFLADMQVNITKNIAYASAKVETV